MRRYVPRYTETRVGQQASRRDSGGSGYCTTNFIPILELLTPSKHCTVRVRGMLHGVGRRSQVGSRSPSTKARCATFPATGSFLDKGFNSIVAEHKWDGVQATERLRVTWSEDHISLPRAGLHSTTTFNRAGRQARGARSGPPARSTRPPPRAGAGLG